MSLVPNIAFRIESLRAERYSFDQPPMLGINMQIMHGKPEKSPEGGYVYGFVVRVECSPPIATIDVKGSVIVVPQSDEERRMIEESAKEQTPPQPILTAVFSYVLPIAALLARELGLPPPCPPPMVQQPPSTQTMPQHT